MHGFLRDDRAFVEVFGGEMRGGADDFYAAFIGLTVWVCAFEAGQEGMVDVDDLAFVFLGEGVGENLHVAGEDDEFCGAFLYYF